MPSVFSWFVPRVRFGPGSLNGIGDEVIRLGTQRLLIVTDPVMVQVGAVERLRQALPAGVQADVYSDLVPEPPARIVEACGNAIRDGDYGAVIGLGGGSALDTAKLGAVLATNREPLAAYYGTDKLVRPGLPVIAIPTTAGTGSEVTPIAIVTDEERQLKTGVVSPHLYPALAICDPELTVTAPPATTAATGMDALTHAIEAYLSVNASPLSDLLALEAVRSLASSLRAAYADGRNLGARTRAMYGALLAGAAFSHAGVAAVHALAYPLGAIFHVPHGVANASLLPTVLEYNMVGCLERMAVLAEPLGVSPAYATGVRARAEAAVSEVARLSRDLEIPASLRTFGVREEDLPAMAEAAASIERLLRNNPRTLNREQALSLYRKALG